ncbi:MAG: molybdate ABC transporter periplasmic molybdate-binding protein [Methanocella sp. PtaU1.Bin125]|nr:MAG: molybdate ABC transporter periplasmic molybdate-binding protein [Methanocella sp. PtaU1.Bin125]
MSDKKRVSIVVLTSIVLISALIVAGCASPTPAPASTPTPTPVPQTDLTVFAAASLTSAFNEIKPAFEAVQPGASVVYNFDGSQALRTQIEQGASADVFASASASHMNALKNQGLMNNASVVTFTNNKLAVIVPKDNPAQVNNLADLAKPGVKIVIGTKDVPVGSYTLQILDKMANDTAYGSAYRTAVMANVVSQETTVNYVVSKVALGEADAGFVYVSDVPAEYRDKVTTIAIPDSLNVIAVYPIGIVGETKGQALAQAYIDFVRSDAGKAILTKNGFSPV